MTESKNQLPQWARRVPKRKIRQLYETDAQGIYDLDLINEVGYALLARCESFVTANRAREGELLRIRFANGSQHPHTIHFHGLHPAAMDGVPDIGAGVIEPGKSTVYEFGA